MAGSSSHRRPDRPGAKAGSRQICQRGREGDALSCNGGVGRAHRPKGQRADEQDVQSYVYHSGGCHDVQGCDRVPQALEG